MEQFYRKRWNNQVKADTKGKGLYKSIGFIQKYRADTQVRPYGIFKFSNHFLIITLIVWVDPLSLIFIT